MPSSLAVVSVVPDVILFVFLGVSALSTSFILIALKILSSRASYSRGYEGLGLLHRLPLDYEFGLCG